MKENDSNQPTLGKRDTRRIPHCPLCKTKLVLKVNNGITVTYCCRNCPLSIVLSLNTKKCLYDGYRYIIPGWIIKKAVHSQILLSYQLDGDLMDIVFIQKTPKKDFGCE